MARYWAAYGAGLLLVQALAGCSPRDSATAVADNEAEAPATPPGQQSDAPLVIAFGDSLFASYRLARDEGLAPALDRALDRAGTDAEVVNAGVSGDTSAAGLARLGFTLDGQARTPALVIVGLGANDMLRGLPPSQTQANLDAMLAELKRRGIPAMVSGMVAPRNMGADYGREFNAVYTYLAEKYDVPLYPFTLDGVIGNRALMLDDGLHPNARGVEVMAGRLAPVVARVLKEQAATE